MDIKSQELNEAFSTTYMSAHTPSGEKQRRGKERSFLKVRNGNL